MGAAVEGGKRKSPRRTALDAVSGAIAGMVSRFVVGPLDVLKIRFQVQVEPTRATGPAVTALRSHYTGMSQAIKQIWVEEGIAGFWRGTLPGQLLTVPYCAVQFVALQKCKEFAHRLQLDNGRQVSSVSFLSGAVAGMAATAASYPFDLLRTTLAAQGEPKVYRGMVDAARGIVREHGFKGLYRGLGVTLAEIVPYAALQFGLYDTFNRWYTSATDAEAHRGPRSVGVSKGGVFQQFVCGLAAGMLSKLATHPLDVVKKRYQVAGLQRSLRYGQRIAAETVAEGLLQTVQGILRKEGVQGLYKGVTPSLIKAAPAAAVVFVVYEVIVAQLAPVMLLEHEFQQFQQGN